MSLKLKELCRRTRLLDGNVTYHYVGEDGRKLVQISRDSFEYFECLAVRTECLYSQSNKLFRRDYKTVRY
ncbi:hypothetical protein D3C75_1025480 [compost metagenome]